MRVPGTSENQNCQFYDIHHFSPIFTFEYYTVIQKHLIAQLTNVLWPIHEKVMSRGHTEKMYSLFGHEKVFLLQR